MWPLQPQVHDLTKQVKVWKLIIMHFNVVWELKDNGFVWQIIDHVIALRNLTNIYKVVEF